MSGYVTERRYPRKTAGGRLPLVAALVSASLACWLMLGAPTSARGDHGPILSISVGSASSQQAAAGPACAEIQVGEVFPVDVRVENVLELRVFELRVTYDSSVLSLEEADFDHFLVSTPPFGQIFPSFFLEEKAGRYFLAAANSQGSPDTGSGVLARLQMRAIGEGMGEIGIQTEPTVFGPRLQNGIGEFIGDETGDGFFDGTVLNGMAAVNANCSGVGGDDPPVSPGDDPDSGSDPGPGNATDDGGEVTDDESAEGSAGGASADGDPADPAEAGDGGDGSAADAEGSDVAPANEDPDTGDSALGEPGNSGSASEGGSGLNFLWYTLIAVGAAAVLGGLGLVVKSRRAS